MDIYWIIVRCFYKQWYNWIDIYQHTWLEFMSVCKQEATVNLSMTVPHDSFNSDLIEILLYSTLYYSMLLYKHFITDTMSLFFELEWMSMTIL